MKGIPLPELLVMFAVCVVIAGFFKLGSRD
jgi:hypothetical protein